MEEYDLHSGVTIPNIDNKNKEILNPGIYAIEPFATLSSGSGKVNDGAPSGIYCLIKIKPIRSQTAREILKFIQEEYQSLPFCSRWLVKRFGTKAMLGLRELESSESIYQFCQLIEASHQIVAQAEDTILMEKDRVITTT
jgi:methionyl aminopeptidase